VSVHRIWRFLHIRWLMTSFTVESTWAVAKPTPRFLPLSAVPQPRNQVMSLSPPSPNPFAVARPAPGAISGARTWISLFTVLRRRGTVPRGRARRGSFALELLAQRRRSAAPGRVRRVRAPCQLLYSALRPRLPLHRPSRRPVWRAAVFRSASQFRCCPGEGWAPPPSRCLPGLHAIPCHRR